MGSMQRVGVSPKEVRRLVGRRRGGIASVGCGSDGSNGADPGGCFARGSSG
jgi:hypothetical protein